MPSLEQQHTIALLKMAAIELRRIAERAPKVALDLSRVAAQLEAESADIERSL